MDVRFSTDPSGFRRMTTEELRKSFLMDHLFVPDEIPMVYSDIDRSITGSAVPVKGALKLLGTKKEMAAEYFAERREIGRGVKEIEFRSSRSDTPAMFYFVSYPAHKEFPTTHAKFSDAEPARLGCQKDANKRTIYKYIHPNGIKSCQLVMGLTELEDGSIWNTMPPHTHQRRSEVYMYFNIEPGSMIVHMMGQPDETRHIIMRNRQAVLNPSWSIHAGAGTQNYTFIWAMGGENQVFDDMDGVKVNDIV